MTDYSVERVLNRGNTLGGVPVTAKDELGAGTHRTAISVNATAQQITIAAGKTAMEIQNTGESNIYYGGAGVDSDKGIIIFPDVIKVFNKLKSTFSLYFVCKTGETSTMRVVEYA